MTEKEIFNIEIKLPYINQQIYVDQNMSGFIVQKILSAKFDKIAVIVDKNLYRSQKKYLDDLFAGLKVSQPIFVEPHESTKNIQQCEKIVGEIKMNQLNRKSCLIAIGGGYVGDITGFIASIYMRGIDFIQIPSTLMSISDAIIGKVSVNSNGMKNLLGTFYSPRFTFCDVSLVTRSDERQVALGAVEIWKHSLLLNDVAMQGCVTELLSDASQYPTGKLIELIKSSLEAKKKFVENDHLDTKGQHKALSLGHTFANYLESKITIPHGAAVLYGLTLSFIVSLKLKKITRTEFERFITVANEFEKHIQMFEEVRKMIDIDDILAKLKFDKINSHNTYTLVLLEKVGFSVCRDIDEDVLRQSLFDLRDIQI